MQVALLVYDTSGAYRGNLRNYGAFNATYSSQVPGGSSNFSCRIPANPRGPDKVPAYLGYGFDLRVVWGSKCLHRYRMGFPRYRETPNDGAYYEVVGVGYGANLGDQYYQSEDQSGKATSTVVVDALSDLTQQLGTASITATGYTIAATATTKAMSAAAVVAWASLFGDSTNAPQVFTAYPLPNGDMRVTFAPRATTSTIDTYLGDFEEPELGGEDQKYANEVLVVYNGGSSFSTASDAAAQAAGRDGFKKVRLVVMPQLTSGTDAAQVANAVLAAAGSARMQAVSLRSRGGLRLPRLINSYGQLVPPWELRAGELLRFRDVNPAAGAFTNLAYNNICLVGKCEWDEDGQTLTIIPETFGDTIDRVLSQASIVLDGRQFVSLSA